MNINLYSEKDLSGYDYSEIWIDEFYHLKTYHTPKNHKELNGDVMIVKTPETKPIKMRKEVICVNTVILPKILPDLKSSLLI